MNSTCFGLVSAALGNGKLSLQITIEPAVFQRSAVAACRQVFQAEVDADRSLPRAKLNFNINDYIEVPSTAGILAETVGAERVLA